MPTDAFEMALVHRVFCNELRSAPQLVDSVQPGQRARLKLVGRHIANVLAALHHHHMAEDELLWPKLHIRIPQHAEKIQRMEAEHEFISKSASAVELRLADWIATTRSPTAPLASCTIAAQALIAELKELARLVDDHLSAEERWVVPLINDNITDAEWRATTERGAAFLSRRNVRFGLAFVGMTLETCTADERRRFLAGMATRQRLLVSLFGRRAANRYRAQFGGMGG